MIDNDDSILWSCTIIIPLFLDVWQVDYGSLGYRRWFGRGRWAMAWQRVGHRRLRVGDGLGLGGSIATGAGRWFGRGRWAMVWQRALGNGLGFGRGRWAMVWQRALSDGGVQAMVWQMALGDGLAMV